jgi:hypothetical protein
MQSWTRLANPHAGRPANIFPFVINVLILQLHAIGREPAFQAVRGLPLKSQDKRLLQKLNQKI